MRPDRVTLESAVRRHRHSRPAHPTTSIRPRHKAFKENYGKQNATVTFCDSRVPTGQRRVPAEGAGGAARGLRYTSVLAAQLRPEVMQADQHETDDDTDADVGEQSQRPVSDLQMDEVA